MTRKLIAIAGLIVVANTASVLFAQIESTLPKKNAQPREAIQPSTTTAPLLKPKPPLDKPPRLTDGATDERGLEFEPGNNEPVGPTEVLTNRRSASLRTRNPDLVMATWIALANHEEIALAELAADRAHNPAVRQYAAAMVKDHEILLNRLRPFAPEVLRRDYLTLTARGARTPEVVIRKSAVASDAPASIATPAPNKTPSRVGPVIDRLADGKPPEKDLTPSVTRTEEDRPRLSAEADVAVRAEPRPALAVVRDFSVVQVERELAAQSLASHKELLANKSGPEFDEWFLAQQIGIHKSLRDKLIIYQRYVSSDLGKVLADGEAASIDHLAQTNDLLSKLKRPVPDAPLPKN